MHFDDSYVIRIFRRLKRTGKARRAHDSVALTGTVEHPGSGTNRAFHDVEELWAVLAQPGEKPIRRRRKRT